MERVISDFEREADSLVEPEARARWLAGAPPRLFPSLAPNLAPVVGPGVALRALAERMLAHWLGDTTALQPLLRALPHNPTTEMDLELWRLARELAAERSAPAPDHPALRAFLARYGHRGVREIDVGMPRWREEPGYLIGLLGSYSSTPAGLDPEERFRRAADEAGPAGRALVEDVRRRRGAVRALALRFALSRVRALAGLREYPKFFGVRFIAASRRVLQAEGASLVAAGRLERADDIFFVRFSEREVDLRALAASRRAEYQRELRRRAVPRVITSEGEVFFTPAARIDEGMVGTPASAGVHEGRVRIVHDPSAAELEPGEVLVAHGTDPAWTPLFLVAGALVMEIGGVMSHGSIVARECGIPAVVGVPNATQRLRTGQLVRVDGQSGLVQLLE
jgi:pyruvate,water dikinase